MICLYTCLYKTNARWIILRNASNADRAHLRCLCDKKPREYNANKVSENARPRLRPNQRECGLFLKTPLTSVNTVFERDWVIIILHDGTFSDIGQKPPFSVIFWPLEGRNLANVAQKRINSEHSSNKCTHQVWIGLHVHFFRKWSAQRKSIPKTHPISIHTQFEQDYMNAFSDNGRKPPFSFILRPIVCQNLVNVAK